ncbi:MAG: TatD family hydrolase [Treponema sp.]|nr:TatD family hydrolase [Treponema sp.]
MLEKNENFCYFDAHFHLADCMQAAGPFDKLRDPMLVIRDPKLVFSDPKVSFWDHVPSNWTACSCSHSIEEWEVVQALQSAVPEPVEGPHKKIYLSYGLHPQSAGHINIKENAAFLEQLLQQKKLHAIGEAGFDYFTQDFRDQATLQEEMFNLQLDLALQYNMPMVIHARKANHKLFEYSRQFKKLPAVLFHSFMGPAREAQSLIAHGINAYFSFGKQLMNNNKKVIECVKELPAQNLLTETDAPWQFLKGEKFTHPAEIINVFKAFCQIRQSPPEELEKIFKSNFNNLFLQKQ